MRSTRSIRIALALALAIGAAGTPFAALAQSAPAGQPAAPPPATQALVPGGEDAATKLTKQLMDGLRAGKLDRTLLAESLSKTITEPMIAQAQGAFAPGAPPQ